MIWPRELTKKARSGNPSDLFTQKTYRIISSMIIRGVCWMGISDQLVRSTRPIQWRLRLASARVLVNRPGAPASMVIYRDVIPLLCSIFMSNQGAGNAAEEEEDDEASLLRSQREAEMMIIEAYTALLLAFLSTESNAVKETIARCLPNHKLEILVPVLERFVAFHLNLNMMTPETHSAVVKVIESCKEP